MASRLPYNVCVIETLAIFDKDNKFIVKELAAFRMNGSQHWFFKKPNNYVEDYIARTSNAYLERQFHGIYAEYGDIPYDNLDSILHDVTFNVHFVFAKGAEKCKFLAERLPIVTVYDLNAVHCIKHYKPTLSCLFHVDRLDKECALRNCLSNAAWLDLFVSFEKKRNKFMKKWCPLSIAAALNNTEFLPFTRYEYLNPYTMESNMEERLKALGISRTENNFRFWRDVIMCDCDDPQSSS